MNVRDSRSFGEQIRSGFRLAGWVLFSLAFIFLLLGCAASLVGKGNYTHPFQRVIAASGLLILCAVMFFTVRHWLKWLVGFLAYFILKSALSFVLGFTPTAPAIVAPRTFFLGMVASLLLAIVGCARYLNRAPRSVETVGLVGMVIALSFCVVLDSPIPILLGTAILFVLQLVQTKWPHLRPVGVNRSK